MLRHPQHVHHGRPHIEGFRVDVADLLDQVGRAAARELHREVCALRHHNPRLTIPEALKLRLKPAPVGVACARSLADHDNARAALVDLVLLAADGR